LVVPAGVVSDVVVVAAEGSEVGHFGGSAVGPRLAVVEVAVHCGHPTTGENTVPVPSFEVAPLGSGGSSSGGAVVDDLAGVGVGESPPPFRTE
jgi:hypothetical protein